MAEPVISQRGISHTQLELQQIEELLRKYSDLFSRLEEEREPSLIELTATASVLHSFYNGVENVLSRIDREIDPTMPAGPQWHRDLLTRMIASTPARKAVLSEELGHSLADYLAFRHFYRNSYSFFLDWGKMKKLVEDLGAVWMRFQQEIKALVEASGARIEKDEPGNE